MMMIYIDTHDPSISGPWSDMVKLTVEVWLIGAINRYSLAH